MRSPPFWHCVQEWRRVDGGEAASSASLSTTLRFVELRFPGVPSAASAAELRVTLPDDVVVRRAVPAALAALVRA